MTMHEQQTVNRAIVLGGGGVTGMAWEIGILKGLLDSGAPLQPADTIIGTSAGSFVGAALASGYDMNKLFDAQLEPLFAEITAAPPETIQAAWYNAFVQGGNNPQSVGAAFGIIARKDPRPIPPDVRRSVVQARLVTSKWPMSLKVTAINADTGKLSVFGHTSGVPLIDAVTASGAVPGVWPLVHMKGEAWIDGGMVSAANARLAEGAKQILILAPMPRGYGSIPGAEEDAAAMRTHADVLLITPDEISSRAIGANPYDPSRCSAVALAGLNQGLRLAPSVTAMWKKGYA